MIINRIKKPKISITVLGKNNFWLGIIFGLVTSILLCLFFYYFKEIFRLLTTTTGDLLILASNENIFYNYFYAALSTTLGLNIAIVYWLKSAPLVKRKYWTKTKLSQLYCLLLFWVIIMAVTRFGSILWITPYGLEDYNNDLNLYSDFSILFYLIIILVFLNSWFTIRLIYQSNHWILYSLLICITLTLIFANTLNINPNIINYFFL